MGMLFSGYVSLFALAALICFLSVSRARGLEDGDTRAGLAWFLVLSGGWAAAHTGYLLAPTEQLQYAFFVAGLLVGLAAVGPWLYLCSAYTGRSLHRDRPIQLLAIGVFVAFAAVKVTNPLHGLYFSAEVTTEPFPHLAIHHEPLHWVAMGLAYALAFIGFFMLVELFYQVSYDAKPLYAILALTALPVVFDVVGAATPDLLDMTYSPLGVAAFAIGVMYVYTERFQAIQLTGEADNPTILVDDDGYLRAANRAARELFPALAGAEGTPLGDLVPEVADALDRTAPIIEVEPFGDDRYYRVSTNLFSTDSARLGRMITLTDVSHREQYRRRLEEQNKRLEQFAGIVSHDLRNPLSVAKGRLELAVQEEDWDQLVTVAASHARMEELIEDLLTLAREGEQIDETEPVEIRQLAEECWRMIDPAKASLEVAGDLSLVVEADEERLRQVFENLFRNAIEHGGDDVRITVGELDSVAGFFVEDTGEGVPADVRDELFEPGFTTRDSGTGFGLAIVAEIVEAHGWEIAVTDAEAGGARFEVTVGDGTTTMGTD